MCNVVVDEGLMKVFFDCSDILKECRVILLLKKKLYIYIYIYIYYREVYGIGK